MRRGGMCTRMDTTCSRAPYGGDCTRFEIFRFMRAAPISRRSGHHAGGSRVLKIDKAAFSLDHSYPTELWLLFVSLTTAGTP